MAAKLFRENPPSDKISQFFRRKSEEYMSFTENATELRDISSFFAELNAAVGVIEEKFTTYSGRNRDLQKLIPIQGMVIRTLKKLHDKIIRRLRSKPTLATPWRGDFTIDLPREVFDVIYQKIVKSNNFGHQSRENAACTDIEITDRRKAVFVFNKMNQDGILVSCDFLLKKCFGNCAGDVHTVERCEVVVCGEKPMRFKYYNNTDVLSVNFHYGYWNQFGVPQP